MKCLLHRSSVHCCHLGVGLCETPMSAVQGQFLECSSVCGPRASVPEPGDMSHHLISSTNQRCHMRECLIRAYVNYLISLVIVIVQHSTQPNQSQTKGRSYVIWSYGHLILCCVHRLMGKSSDDFHDRPGVIVIDIYILRNC